MNNTFKTLVFLSILTSMFVFAGLSLGGTTGAILALFFAALVNFFSYWYSASIVLAMYGAKELSEQESPHIHSMVEETAKKAGIPKPKIFLAPLRQPNAFATGRNPEHGTICFTYGILEALDKEELEGVIAHELSHIKNKDILIVSIVATIAGALTLLARFSFYFGYLFPSKEKGNVIGSLLSILFLVIVTPLVALLLQLAISRSREYLADSTGAAITGNPIGLANALKKLEHFAAKIPLPGDNSNRATAQLFIVNPFEKGFFTSIFSTHPPLEKRVEKLSALAHHKGEQ